jgi:hypothetical protein
MLENTCLEFQDIFLSTWGKTDLYECSKIFHNSGTRDSPINTKPYRLPETQKAEIEKQVDKLLDKGIIEENNSPWNSPLLVVPKKTDASGEKK